MTFQWTLVAIFLYTEIAVVFLLSLPIIPPRKWNQFFKSRFFTALRTHSAWYFTATIFVLILFLVDAIREIKKYSETISHEHGHSHLDSEMQSNMRLFRAQRNFYIVGFSLFLCLVIRRFVTLITSQATLMAQCEAALSQARNANTAARKYLSGKDEENENISTNDTSKIQELEDAVKELEAVLEKEKKDKEAVISQSASVSTEYDRLLKEHEILQKLAGASGDKKSD